jgi:hypothetical protein
MHYLLVICLDDWFSCLNPFWTIALSLAHLSCLFVDSQNSLEAWSEGSDARRTSDVIINDNWRSSLTMEKLKMKLQASLRLLGVEDMKHLLAWVFDCYRNFEPIIPWSTIILDYLKPLMHIVCSQLSLQSFLFNPTKSYLSSANSLAPASLNLGVRFFLREIVCHIPKFLFQNVNHFPQ